MLKNLRYLLAVTTVCALSACANQVTVVDDSSTAVKATQKSQDVQLPIGTSVSAATLKCKSGDSFLCMELVGHHLRNRNYPMMLEASQTACDQGVHSGCMVAGALLRTGESGVPQNSAEALTTYMKSCSLLGSRSVIGPNEAAVACRIVGEMHFSGELTKIDNDLAFNAFEKSCNGGDTNGCYNLGYSFRVGIGTGINKEMAFGLFKDACENGHSRGCIKISLMYKYGETVPADETVAAYYWKRGCDLRNPNDKKLTSICR